MAYSTENKILQHLTGKQSAGDVTVDELSALANEYPAFGVTKYLLAKKAKNEGHAGADKFIQAAVLHFSNPYWFHFKLNEGSLMATQPVDDADENQEKNTVTQAEEGAAGIFSHSNVQQAGTDLITMATEERIDERKPITDAVAENGEVELEQVVTTSAPGPDIVMAPSAIEENVNEQYSVEEVPVITGEQPEIEPITEEDPTPEIDETVSPEHADAEVVTAGYVENTTLEQPVIEDEHPAENTYEPKIVLTGSREAEADETEYIEDADAEREAVTAAPLLGDKISSILQDQVQEFNKPVNDETPVPIETEPYHTVDYFASQGIKLSAELLKQDHLGVKVKKFTDWLKQMKRKSPTPADLGIDEAAEHKVQDIAAESNEAKEVLTEAMADVLAMQGMTEKAIQVYIKLSFLDPSKTAYFASKIENLKGL